MENENCHTQQREHGDRVDTERSGGHSRETHMGRRLTLLSGDAECRP